MYTRSCAGLSILGIIIVFWTVGFKSRPVRRIQSITKLTERNFSRKILTLLGSGISLGVRGQLAPEIKLNRDIGLRPTHMIDYGIMMIMI